MTFNSLSYFVFLPLVYSVFYVTKDRFRWVVLLAASYGFYATFKAPQLLFALVLVTAVSYLCGIQLRRTSNESRRKRLLWTGVAACLMILAAIKYLPLLVHAEYNKASLLISIGVSYFTFQAISYLADIYLEIQEPEYHFGYHALCLAFFPKLLQGPIERTYDLLPQLKQSYRFDYDTMRAGILLFTWGLFKKVVVADRLALYANTVYNDVPTYHGLAVIVGTYAYALQIYFDFAGYTDMARGTAKMFGITLSENFNMPYSATSIADFWRRWHISFSRWILDYIFKPLQMAWRDCGQSGTACALIVTFFVSGIWHGASWGFVIWGVLHGTYLASSTYYRPYQRRLHKWLGIEKSNLLKAWQVFVTFNMVSFAWIFFRAGSVSDACYLIRNIFYVNSPSDGQHIAFGKYLKDNVLLGHGDHNFIVTLSVLTSILAVNLLKSRYSIYQFNVIVRWSTYYIVVLSIVLFGVFKGDSFVYFKF
jgi:D-alanyl-lipoteichoic acid acyltransferase DltB (MBOAT superfamily)